MCGILGIVANTGAAVGLDESQVLSMRDAMQSRGPDAAGLFQNRNIAFAHRRLAIRDLAGGVQPWVSDDRRCVLVYNGEVYNDGELRQELAALGHRFRSHCDTEVVMAAYRQWGTESVSRLRGMFAFGIYDFRDDSLFLARDRFGIKPLFLTEVDGRLIFASSIAALIRHPGFVKEPNFSVLSHYLTTFRLTLGRETVFRGIWQLQPGETLRWRAGQVEVKKYWDYPTGEDDSPDYSSAARDLHESLQEAVAARLASDVPVGMFMSGGVDSNTIACMVRELTPKRLVGQCGGGADGQSDDFTYARRCAEHVQFDFDEVRVGPDEYLRCWQWMLDEYATPLSTPTDVILYRLSQEMKKSVGVVLGGEGADELLCGYAVPHWAGHDFDRYNQLSAGRWPASSAGARLFRGSLLKQYGRDRFESAVDHYFALNSLIPTAAKPLLLQPWVWQQAGEDRRMWGLYSALFDELGEQTTQRKHTVLLHRVNLEALLGRLDSSTMLASLEARVPYTDHRLVERMFRLPGRFKIDVAHTEHAPYLASGELQARKTLRSKRILRTVAAGLMPASLARRKKASFPTPVERWLSDDWAGWVRETLRTSRFGRAVFQPQPLKELADNPSQAGMWLWPLLNVVLWGDRQFG